MNAVLNGHVHSYESTKPLTGGTGSSVGTATTDALGTRYLVFGGGGAGLYGFKATQAYIQTRESVHGFAIMSASATEMKWTAFRADGSTIETIAMPEVSTRSPEAFVEMRFERDRGRDEALHRVLQLLNRRLSRAERAAMRDDREREKVRADRLVELVEVEVLRLLDPPAQRAPSRAARAPVRRLPAS